MPIKDCVINGEKGYKWGQEGACYPYQPGNEASRKEAKKKAIAQGIAIGDYEAVGAHINEVKQNIKAAAKKVSFDFDGVLTTKRGRDIFRTIEGDKYVITARNRSLYKEVYEITDLLQIPRSKVIFTGSNTEKIRTIRRLNIETHYDNNQDVINKLPVSIGMKFSHIELESYTDYPEAVKKNAQRALDYVEKNGWKDCGTPVGKIRANQLANGEPISEDTIARMASFARHLQYDDKELGDGCGKLMILAWGGREGVEWSQRKLKQIRKEDLAE